MNDLPRFGPAVPGRPAPGPSFEHVARIDSTSAELMRRSFAAAGPAPTVLLADEQDAGRGRNGRRWLSDPACSVTFSVSVERHADGASLLGLPLAVGAAIAEVLDAHGAQPLLKWPNDLWRDGPDGGAKAGGILVEVRQFGERQRIVAGCGLNLSPSARVDADRVGRPVAAVFAPGAAPERIALARVLGAAVAATLERFPVTGLAPYLAGWRSRDALAGRAIDLIRPDGRREPGRAEGIDDEGALQVALDDGRRERLIAGEVSVRPR
jgi:BirA family transcriptional regulator, biotin operon repressor / biotin---[acetyl-CoA-carboxylase] ligase